MAFPFVTTDQSAFFIGDGNEYLVPSSSLFDQQQQQPLSFDLYKAEPQKAPALIFNLDPGDRVQQVDFDGSPVLVIIKPDSIQFENRGGIDPPGTSYLLFVGQFV